MERRGFVEIAVAVGCGCLVLFALGFAGMVALGVFSMNNMGDGGGSGSSSIAISDQLSSFVPTNYAKLFSEASEITGTPASIIATVFMNEHHNDRSFGTDLADLDELESPCSENGPYKGPMQMGEKEWASQVPKLRREGIATPEICRYRDSFIAAGFLLGTTGKVDNGWATPVCKAEDGSYTLTDECVYRWAQSYCYAEEKGCRLLVSEGGWCSNSSWFYCEKAVVIFHLITGGN